MTKVKKVSKRIIGWKVILILQLLATIALSFFVIKLGALPPLFLAAFIVLMVLLLACSYFLMKPSKHKGKGKIRQAIGKIVSLLLSIVLVVASLYIARGNDTLEGLTGANTKTSRYSIYVLASSSYEDIYDIKRKNVEISSDHDEKIDEAVKELKDTMSTITIKEIDEFTQLADDLYNGKTDAILIDEGVAGMFEEKHPNFEAETRIIWTHEIDEIVEEIVKEVNVTKEPFNIYVSGIDTKGKVSTVSRSDVNMIVTVNPKTKQILMTSIPRDYYVTLANKGKKDKLTHSGLAGTENTVKTVENFMDIDINYYVRVNFTSIIKIVNALGGITVTVPFSFYSGVDGSLFKKGTQTFNGEEAMKYCRERKAFGGGDGARIQNQQIVLSAMIKKMISPKIITKYSDILDAIDGSFETNMKSTDITNLLQMQLDDMASWDIQKQSLTGKGTSMTGGAYMPNHKVYYLIPDQSSIDKAAGYINEMLKGKTITID